MDLLYLHGIVQEGTTSVCVPPRPFPILTHIFSPPDVGASQMIIDGKIKLKNDSLITSYTPTGLAFSDSSHLDADIIIFATGFGEYRDSLKGIFTPEQHAMLKPTWGLDEEGELRGCYRDMGIPRLWCMMGKRELYRAGLYL